MPAGPMLLISKSVRAPLPQWHGPLGQLFTPRLLTSLDITEGCGIQWPGVIMWIPAGGIYLAAALVLLVTWIRATEREDVML
jgi:hypothetical protein